MAVHPSGRPEDGGLWGGRWHQEELRLNGEVGAEQVMVSAPDSLPRGSHRNPPGEDAVCPAKCTDSKIFYVSGFS